MRDEADEADAEGSADQVVAGEPESDEADTGEGADGDGFAALALADDTVAFRLIDGDGKPIADQAVTFTLADGSTREAVTDGDGKVFLEGVPPGDCQATIEGVGDGEMEPV